MGYQVIDLKGNNTAIGLQLQEDYVLLLEVRDGDNYRLNEELSGTIVQLHEEQQRVKFSQFHNFNGLNLDYVWQQMEVTHEEWDYDMLEELFPESACYWYLMKTHSGQYCIGSHVGPCNPMPFYYLKDPTDLQEFIDFMKSSEEKTA